MCLSGKKKLVIFESYINLVVMCCVGCNKLIGIREFVNLGTFISQRRRRQPLILKDGCTLRILAGKCCINKYLANPNYTLKHPSTGFSNLV